MNNIAMYPSLMGSPMGNMISPSVKQDIGQDYCPQLYNSSAENKENLNSSTEQGMLPSPGFAPNPYFFMNNSYGIGSPAPFYPQLLQTPVQSPPFTPILNSPNESTEQADAEGAFDRLQLQRLLAARALLNLKNNFNFDNSQQDENLSNRVEESNELKLTSEIKERSTNEEQGINTTPSPPNYASILSPGSTVRSTSPLSSNDAPITNPVATGSNHKIIDAITPKSKKAGQSILLKSNVPGFNTSRRRATKRMTPDSEKDNKYYERRVRNNISAKRSRDLRKCIEGTNSIKVSKYEHENSILRAQKEKYIEEREYLLKLIAEAKLKKGLEFSPNNSFENMKEQKAVQDMDTSQSA